MDSPADNPARPVILLTGGSGYVGGRLIPLLEQQPVILRCLARNPDKMRSRVQPGTEIVQGDVLDPASLEAALQGVTTAYYLVHLMSGSKDFEKDDRQAAVNFAGAAKEIEKLQRFSSESLRVKEDLKQSADVSVATSAHAKPPT